MTIKRGDIVKQREALLRRRKKDIAELRERELTLVKTLDAMDMKDPRYKVLKDVLNKVRFTIRATKKGRANKFTGGI